MSAYEKGFTGSGIKIAVIDSGINPSLGEFAGKIDPASRDLYNTRGVSDEDGHGTAVSAVAMAAKNNSGMHGVAFDSTVISLRADQPGSCATTGDDGGCKFFDSAIAQGIDAARLAGAKVINLSLGGDGIGSAVMSAMQRAVNAGIIIVIAAGNDGREAKGSNPSAFALTPAQQFPGRIIIAGSIGAPNGTGGTNLDQISEFSNRAGTGAAWYLTALGHRVITPDETGTLYYMSGTSFAAPVISGAVALLAQAFPNLSAAQIIDILFKSADDLGAPGVDSIYGHGRLNITRAFQPIGTTTVAGTSTPATGATDLPGAAGDSGSSGPMGAIILDGYDRAFVMDFAKTLRQAEQAKPLARSLQGGVKMASAAAGPLSVAMTVSERRDLPMGFAIEKLGIGPEDARKARLVAGSAIAQLDGKSAAAFGFREGAKSLERRLSGAEAGAFLIAKDIAGDPGFAAQRDGSMALRRDLGPVGLTISSENGKVWHEVENSATGSPYRWNSVSLDRNFGSTWLSASVSRLEEKRTLLGGRMGPALGGDGSSSLFLDLEARHELGRGISAGVSARRGWTTFGGGRFETGAYGVDVAKSGVLGSDDRIGLRVSQPLRVERGGFSLMLPTAYDYATTSATNSLVRYSLTPSGREIDGEISYSTRLVGDRGWLGGNLFMRRQPGHVASADNDYGAAIRFTLGF
ncbi:MAG TPA: S8 family peptidase [Sphingomicrobium sp.]|nr:S8 family peptidase [Sphingomicrobium sp.]